MLHPFLRTLVLLSIGALLGVALVDALRGDWLGVIAPVVGAVLAVLVLARDNRVGALTRDLARAETYARRDTEARFYAEQRADRLARDLRTAKVDLATLHEKFRNRRPIIDPAPVELSKTGLAVPESRPVAPLPSRSTARPTAYVSPTGLDPAVMAAVSGATLGSVWDEVPSAPAPAESSSSSSSTSSSSSFDSSSSSSSSFDGGSFSADAGGF